MIKWIMNLFRCRNKQLVKPAIIHSITFGQRDEDGFADTYVNGKKTNVRMLLWTKEEINKLHKIAEELHRGNDNE